MVSSLLARIIYSISTIENAYALEQTKESGIGSGTLARQHLDSAMLRFLERIGGLS